MRRLKSTLKDVILTVQADAANGKDFGEEFTKPDIDQATAVLLGNIVVEQTDDWKELIHDQAFLDERVRKAVKDNPALAEQLDDLEKELDNFLRKTTPYFYNGEYKKYVDTIFPEPEINVHDEVKIVDDAINFLEAAKLL